MRITVRSMQAISRHIGRRLAIPYGKVDAMSQLKMPPTNQDIFNRREEILAALRRIVPGEGVIATERQLRAYESDGLTAYRQTPLCVVLPETVEQVSEILKYCQAQ